MKRWILALMFVGLVGANHANAYTLSGTVTGAQAGFPPKYIVAVPVTFDTVYFTAAVIVNNFAIGAMDSGGYVIFGFQDLNLNFRPDLDEPRGFYGGATPTIFDLRGDSSGVVVALQAANTPGFSGTIGYGRTHTGPTYVIASYTPTFDVTHGGSVLTGDLLAGQIFNDTGNGAYTALVDSFTTYYVKAYMDLNGNVLPDADEPQGFYGGATPAPITVAHSSFPDNVDIVMLDASAAPEIAPPGQKSISLGNAYPNPFNSETVLPFTLEKESRITVAAYDLMGRPAKTISEGQFTAGAHAVRFSAGDLPSGVYMVRLQTGSVTLARRVILVK